MVEDMDLHIKGREQQIGLAGRRIQGVKAIAISLCILASVLRADQFRIDLADNGKIHFSPSFHTSSDLAGLKRILNDRLNDLGKFVCIEINELS